jgi:hypothetical protein
MDEQKQPDAEGFYSFANDGCGKPFLINPRDCDHEIGERESFGVYLSELFVAKQLKRK